MIYSVIYFNNFKNFVFSFIVYIHLLYIFVNLYTTKISSIRVQILQLVKDDLPILTEEDLYNNRKLRIINIKNKYKKLILNMFLKVINIFRYFFNHKI